jgi:hypothetical protein
MKWSEIIENKIDEYQSISAMPLSNIDCSSGKFVGRIGIKALSSQLEIWKLDEDSEIVFGAIDPSINPSDPVGYLGFSTMSGSKDILIARAAFIKPAYRRKGIQSELFQFVNKVEGFKILSDTQLTPDGEALWNSLLKSPHFTSAIVYAPTGERFAVSDVGKMKTVDGFTIISPKDDYINVHQGRPAVFLHHRIQRRIQMDS